MPFNPASFQDLPDLPVRAVLPTLLEALNAGRAALLRAEPGAGKTTLVPLALARESSRRGKILVLEPRRLAAVATAARMASLSGTALGDLVGYAVRGERKSTDRTRIEVLTEGLFTKRLIGDPGLEGVDTILFDEFHERSIHSDLALSLVLELMTLRDDLRLLVMSATMDVKRVQSFLAQALSLESVPLIESHGRQYPIDIQHAPIARDGYPLLPANRLSREELVEGTARAVESCGGMEGTILVFLPGRLEIEDVRRSLREKLPHSIPVLALHGSLSLAEQRKVLDPPRDNGARVVLCTNIAETSLTVPGVVAVVDTGLVKVNRWHAASLLDRLVTEAVDAFSVDQRSGRAGRLGPGRAIRLWDPDSFAPKPRESEILRSELSSLVLDCAALGIVAPESLPWLDQPPAHALEEAKSLLGALGALDAKGAISAKGRLMSRLGLDVRSAALVSSLAGTVKQEGLLAGAALVAALLAEGSGPESPGGRETESLEERFASFIRQRPGEWKNRVQRTASELLDRLGPDASPNARNSLAQANGATLPVLPADSIPASFPDSLAKRESPGLFRLVTGREVLVEGPLSNAPWLAILEADAGERRARSRLALEVSEEKARHTLEALARTEEVWDWKALEPYIVERRMARRLELSNRRYRAPCARLVEALAALLAARGLSALPWDEDHALARETLDRLRFFASHPLPRRGGAPNVGAQEKSMDKEEDISLSDRLDSLLPSSLLEAAGPALREKGPLIDAAGLAEALLAIPSYEERRLFEREVPAFFTSPAGARHRISYAGGTPSVRVKIQECFGLASSPRILGIPLCFELLSPAQRPVQLTSDLANFWASTWQEVRKELRGRYPKHYWPEDPSAALPTSRVRPRE